MNPLKWYRRNTQVLYVKLCDFELHDGDKFFFTVKVKPDDDVTDHDALIDKQWVLGTDCEINDEGYVVLNISADDTNIDFGDYYYDIKIVTSDQSASQTLVFGKLTIMDVTTLED